MTSWALKFARRSRGWPVAAPLFVPSKSLREWSLRMVVIITITLIYASAGPSQFQWTRARENQLEFRPNDHFRAEHEGELCRRTAGNVVSK